MSQQVGAITVQSSNSALTTGTLVANAPISISLQLDGTRQVQMQGCGEGASNNAAPIPLSGDRCAEIENPILQRMQQELKRTYSQLKMHGCPWNRKLSLDIHKHYMEVLLENAQSYCGLNGRNRPRDEQLKSIFDAADKRGNSKKILVVGRPGYGKTALATKLAYDWSVPENYIEHFKLVFLLNLRLLSGSFEHMLLKSNGIACSDENLICLNTIMRSSKPVLLLVDDFDEASEEVKRNFETHAESFTEVTIVISSPSSNRTYGTNKLTISHDVSSSGDFYDKSFTLKGFNKTQQNEFLNNSCIEREKIDAYLKKLKVPEELMESPLFLLFFVWLIKEKEPQTKTDFYGEVISLYFTRYVSKYHYPNTDKINVFEFSSEDPHSEFQHLFNEIRQFSLQAVEKQDYSFSIDDILTAENGERRDEGILKLGILQPTEPKGYTHETIFRPSAKVLLDYLAAFELKSTSNAISNCWERYRPEPNGTQSLVFPFLIGLLGDKAECAYRVLKCHALQYRCNFSTLIQCLSETNINEQILESITCFLPVEWKIRWHADDNEFSNSSQHEKILSYGIEKNHIRHIIWEMKYPARIPKRINANILQLEFEAAHSEVEFQNLELQCSELWCNVKGSQTSANEDLLDEIWFIKFDGISFHLDTVSAQVWLPYINNIMTEAISWNEYSGGRDELGKLSIICTININDPGLLSTLACIIGSDRVTEASITLSSNFPHSCTSEKIPSNLHSQEKFNELVTRVGKSYTLKRLKLSGCESTKNTLRVDLVQLCDGGKKHWKMLHLEHFIIDCSKEMSHSSSILYLNLLHADIGIVVQDRLINNFCIRALACSLSLIQSICIKHLTEICLNYDEEMAVQKPNLRLLTNGLEKLKVVSLTLTSFPYDKNFDSWFFGAGNESIKLEGFAVWCIQKNPYFANKLVKSLIARLQEPSDSAHRKIELDYFTMHTELVPDINNPRKPLFKKRAQDFNSIVSKLKNPLIKRSLVQIHIICYSELLSYNARENDCSVTYWENLFAQSEGFIVEHGIWGMRNNAAIKTKQQLDERFITWLYDEDNRFYWLSTIHLLT